MNRPTLSALVHERTGLKVHEFCTAVGMTRNQVNAWWRDNRLALRLLIAGYEREVLGK